MRAGIRIEIMIIVLNNELFRYGYVQGKDKVHDRCQGTQTEPGSRPRTYRFRNWVISNGIG